MAPACAICHRATGAHFPIHVSIQNQAQLLKRQILHIGRCSSYCHGRTTDGAVQSCRHGWVLVACRCCLWSTPAAANRLPQSLGPQLLKHETIPLRERPLLGHGKDLTLARAGRLEVGAIGLDGAGLLLDRVYVQDHDCREGEIQRELKLFVQN